MGTATRWARARVCGLSQFGSDTTGGLVYETLIGTSWIRPKSTTAIATNPLANNKPLRFIR